MANAEKVSHKKDREAPYLAAEIFSQIWPAHCVCTYRERPSRRLSIWSFFQRIPDDGDDDDEQTKREAVGSKKRKLQDNTKQIPSSIIELDDAKTNLARCFGKRAGELSAPAPAQVISSS